MNTATFLLRAKQVGLSLEELNVLDFGTVLDMFIESQNDMHADEYTPLASQEDFDNFG